MEDFQARIKEIDEVLEKKRSRWHLYLGYMDFDDVSQIVRTHIYVKLNLYDKSRPFKVWASKVADSQIKNLVRNHYGKVAPPCNSCAYNGGGTVCIFTPSGSKCAECPLYKKWEVKKKNGYGMKFATSIDELTANGTVFPVEAAENFDLNESILSFHKKMEEKLSEKLFQIYKIIYIEGHPDITLSKILGLKNNEKTGNSKRVPGYKQIYNYKEQIFQVAKQVMQDFDIIK